MDVGGGAEDRQVVGPGLALRDAHVAVDAVEGEALVEEVAEIQGQASRQLRDPEQAEHAPGARFQLQQPAVLHVHRDLRIQRGQGEGIRAAAPAGLDAELALAARQLAAQAEAAQQRADVIAVHVQPQLRARSGRASAPGPAGAQALLAAAGGEFLHAQATAAGHAAEPGVAQHRLAEAQVGDVEQQRRDARRVEALARASDRRGGPRLRHAQSGQCPVEALEAAGHLRAIRARHQQRALDAGTAHLHRGAAWRGCEHQGRIGEIGAEQAQGIGLHLDAAQRQSVAAGLPRHHADPVQRLQALHAPFDLQAVQRRRLHRAAPEPRTHPGLPPVAAAAQGQQAAEVHRHLAALHRQGDVDRRRQRLRRRLAQRFRQVDRGADQAGAQPQLGRWRGLRRPARDPQRDGPRRAPAHPWQQPVHAATRLGEQGIDADGRLQVGLEGLLRVAHVRTGAQRQRPGQAGVAHLQALGDEAQAVEARVALDALEHQVPARLLQPRAGQRHGAVDLRRWRAVVQRQLHAEAGIRGALCAQGIHRRPVLALQRAVAQHREHRPGIAGGARLHRQLGVAEARDARLQHRDGHAGQASRAGQGEAIGLEAERGVHVLRGGPIALELQQAVLDPCVDAEQAGAGRARRVSERPVAQVAGDDRVHVAQASALQRGVQPGDGRLRHEVVDPEAGRRLDRRFADVGGDVQARAPAAGREADPAARVDLQVAAVDGQPRGLHRPAVGVVPGHGFAIQGERVDHAEAGGPIEGHLRLRIEPQPHAAGIGDEIAGHAAHARAVADRREMQAAHARTRLHRPAAYAADGHLLEHRTRR